jgi:hypothetical protein
LQLDISNVIDRHKIQDLLLNYRRCIDTMEGQWRILGRVATTEWAGRQSEKTQWPIPDSMRHGQGDGSDIIYQPWRE